MNGLICVDASVAVKWVLSEEYSEEAESLLRQAVQGGSRVIAPHLLYAEAANAIYQQFRRGNISWQRAIEALELFAAAPIEYLSPAGLASRALQLASQYNLNTTYDAYYIALADLQGCELWTDDRRLLEALGRHVSRMRWIADYSYPKK